VIVWISLTKNACRLFMYCTAKRLYSRSTMPTVFIMCWVPSNWDSICGRRRCGERSTTLACFSSFFLCLSTTSHSFLPDMLMDRTPFVICRCCLVLSLRTLGHQCFHGCKNCGIIKSWWVWVLCSAGWRILLG